ncbi:ferrochelatase [Desulfobulbus alkaliphilus]|uniref:ferrochelatase n=1 Tax=Desulfobulbus alkaliphilus TaxID=869814 RepID=UPI001962C09B|nr:ferrochelatase [Desulfobulbus alkaliphilus]MBM9535967.1 ferrochelatase [Desulfobulbus alkaliphilus]
MNTSKKIGVLLLNLGGPRQLEDVKPFLFNLFSDRQIIRLGPAFLQKTLARIIAHRRAPKSREYYRRIGGGSPILEKTREQAQALEDILGQEGDFLVRPCMRYWHPFAREALTEMAAAGVDELIALPLYPQYSLATTGSSLQDLYQTQARYGPDVPLREIRSWPAEPNYIACLAARIKEGLHRFGDQPVQLLYSAHSLPVRFIEEGDPYVTDLEKTIKALEEQTGLKGELCYQSRSGPVQWIGPSTPELLARSAAAGTSNVLVVPLSFVSDHVETLYEIDIEYRQMAADLGMRLECTRGLNDDPLFIDALRNLVRTSL